MRKLFLGLIVLALAIIGVLIAAPSFIPAEVYRGPLATALARSTGRDVSIDGDVSLSFFPRFEILLQDVTVGNSPNGKAAYFAKMEELDVVIDLLALLKGSVRVDRFELISPDINLEDSAKGEPNWSFSPHQDSSQAPVSTSQDTTAPSSFTPALDLSDISLRDVRLVDGRVTYRGKDGAVSTYDGINVQFSLNNLDSPLLASGAVTLDDHIVNLSVDLKAPRILIDGGESPVSIQLASDLGETAFDGALSNKKEKISFKGSYDLDVPSLRRLSAALGSPIEGTSGFGALKMSGQINANDKRVLFQKTKLKFDGMSGSGDLTLALTGVRPKLTGALALDVFNANAFTSTSGQPGGQAPSAAEWSTAKMDFSALRSLDADLRVSAGKILFDKIKIGKGDLDLKITNGLLNAALGQVSLYGGTGKGSLTINARTSTPQIATTFALTSINTQTFLRDAMDFDRLEGIGDISYALTTNGNSESAFIRRLSGNGRFQIADGAWRGVNLANLARTAIDMFGKKKEAAAATDQTAPTDGTSAPNEETPVDTSNESKTDFAEMTGTFTINKGQVSNKDLLLLNPFLRVTGGGNVDLIKQSVKYRIRTKIVGDIAGQGGSKDAAGFTVPIIVKGNWDRLSYRPDLTGLITDNLIPGAAEGQDPISGLIDGLLGGKKKAGGTEQTAEETPADQSESEPKPLRPKDLLKDLFGGSTKTDEE